jgi:hypothetical protein
MKGDRQMDNSRQVFIAEELLRLGIITTPEQYLQVIQMKLWDKK